MNAIGGLMVLCLIVGILLIWFGKNWYDRRAGAVLAGTGAIVLAILDPRPSSVILAVAWTAILTRVFLKARTRVDR